MAKAVSINKWLVAGAAGALAWLCIHKKKGITGIGAADNKRVLEAIEYLIPHDDKFRYQILSRMKMDCEYYLGNGGRNAKYLWMSGDPAGHIKVMYALWDSFAEKPEWLTRKEIDEYAKLMLEDDDRIFFVDNLDGRYSAQFQRGMGNSVVVKMLMNSPSGNVFTEMIWRSDNLRQAIAFAEHYWDENGIEYDPFEFSKVEL